MMANLATFLGKGDVDRLLVDVLPTNTLLDL
jgi:hypothetical protein